MAREDTVLTHFQARARGFLVRREVGRAREDFEDIVNEIDGDLAHVLWSRTVIPAPRFTDVDDPYVPSSDVSKPTDSGVDVSTSPQSSAAWAASLSPKTGGDPALLLLQKTVPERDDSQSRDLACHSQDCFHNNHVEVSELDLRRRGQEGDKDVTDVESTGNSTSNWGSLDLDVNNICSHPGLRQYCLAQDVPQTPEGLRLHRNTLTMELVWIQQAIDSRKKYLSLKNRLTVS